MSASFFNTVVSIHDGLSFSFIQHHILDYLYETIIYNSTWCKMKIPRSKLTTIVLPYWFIYISLVVIGHSEVTSDMKALANLYEFMICIYRYYNLWIFMNVYDNYVGILVYTRWLFFNDLFLQIWKTSNIRFSRLVYNHYT